MEEPRRSSLDSKPLTIAMGPRRCTTGPQPCSRIQVIRASVFKEVRSLTRDECKATASKVWNHFLSLSALCTDKVHPQNLVENYAGSARKDFTTGRVKYNTGFWGTKPGRRRNLG